MNDVDLLKQWQPRFDSWKESSIPLVLQGRAKEAFQSYPWFRAERGALVSLPRPVSDTRVAVISTAGYSIEGEQAPFDLLIPFHGGEPEIRPIPYAVDRSRLRIDHPGYDHRFADRDINVNLPLDRMRELENGGRLGSLADPVQVLMGLIPDVAALLTSTVPQLVESLKNDGAEAVVLVPS
ncbi:MAG: glycine/sarcosine/betaine reductase selenoprotein B family protein [Candidatus Binatia bacterium]